MNKELLKEAFEAGQRTTQYAKELQYGGAEYWDKKPPDFEQWYNSKAENLPVSDVSFSVWVPVSSVLPQTGVRVKCKLSKDIGLGITEKSLYRMKHNGRWNDYHNLVTHWKPNEI